MNSQKKQSYQHMLITLTDFIVKKGFFLINLEIFFQEKAERNSIIETFGFIF